MTPLRDPVHERCKTEKCCITTATVCITTVAAVVARQWQVRLMNHILSRPSDNAKEEQERVRGKGRVAKEGK